MEHGKELLLKNIELQKIEKKIESSKLDRKTAKLKLEDILAIRINELGLTKQQLQEKYNVSNTTIWAIQSYKIWREIKITDPEQLLAAEMGRELLKENMRLQRAEKVKLLMLSGKMRRAKLKLEDVRFIRLHKEKYSNKELGQMFDVNPETIRIIRNNESWKDV